MNPDRIIEAAEIIQRNTGIDVLPAKQPTLDECADMLLELVNHLHINKIAYRKDACEITSSTHKAMLIYERIKGKR